MIKFLKFLLIISIILFAVCIGLWIGNIIVNGFTWLALIFIVCDVDLIISSLIRLKKLDEDDE